MGFARLHRAVITRIGIRAAERADLGFARWRRVLDLDHTDATAAASSFHEKGNLPMTSGLGGTPFPGSGRVPAPREVDIPPLDLPGLLSVPDAPQSIVIFAHGSGSSRLSPRNNAVARALNAEGIATLLFDLLTPEEEADRANVFDIPLLAGRLIDAIQWVEHKSAVGHLPIGLFGASTGAAAALVAASKLPEAVGAVVSRGGRPDLAGDALPKIHAPSLMIVGGADSGVIELNEQALQRMRCPSALEIVPGATHLFPEPGALEAVIAHATRWFKEHLAIHRHGHGGKGGHDIS